MTARPVMFSGLERRVAAIATLARGRIASPVLWLFLLAIYLANGAYIWAGDSYPASAFVLNAIFSDAFHFDKLCLLVFGGPIPYFFQRDLSGHLISSYPIGSTIFYLPLHMPLGLVEWLGVGSCDPAMGVSHFEACRLFNDKITSAVVAAFNGVLFWRLSAQYLSLLSTRIASTIIFALGTDAFVVTAHTNFQHGPTITLLLLGWLALKRARSLKSGACTAANYLLIGFLAGFLVSVRPSNVLFFPAFAWALCYSRRLVLDGLSMLCGVLVGAFGIYWNVANFSNLLGGHYGSVVEHLFEFSPEQFIQGLSGLMISPARGLLVFTPVSVVALVGMVSYRHAGKNDAALNMLQVCSILVLVMYCFYKEWGGGWSFGPRFLVDVMPVWIMSAAIYVESCRTRSVEAGAAGPGRMWYVFILLGCIGMANQIAGAFGANGAFAGRQWDFYGYPDDHDARYWRLDDSPLQRDYLAMFYKLRWHDAFYGRVADGRACVLRADQEPVRSTLRLLVNDRYRQLVFAVNLGRVPWIGVRGGAPVPPSLIYGDGGQAFVLADAFVRPGAVGTFIDIAAAAKEDVATDSPRPTERFMLGGRQQSLGCQ